MSDRHLSLTDVMLGMERLSLHNVLSPANFRFFWGLVMVANKLNPRFKNPFDLTVNQAIGAGGGESRQGVNRRQHALKKVRIDGKWLIKIKPGSKINNRPALYEIHYDLIVPSHLAVPVFERQPSQKQDGVGDGTQDGVDDDHSSLLRSDQKRGEENTHTRSNIVTTSNGDENEKRGDGMDVSVFFSEKEKTKEEIERLDDLLRRHHVRTDARKGIIDKYQYDYLRRQIAQIDKDFEKGITFKNPAGALVARIHKGHETEDYPA